MVKTVQKINLHFPVLNFVVDIVQHFCQQVQSFELAQPKTKTIFKTNKFANF